MFVRPSKIFIRGGENVSKRSAWKADQLFGNTATYVFKNETCHTTPDLSTDAYAASRPGDRLKLSFARNRCCLVFL